MTDIASSQFGISEFTTNPWSFEEDIAHYTRHEIKVIEVCESKLNQAKTADQLAMALDAGLTISSVQPAVRTLFPSESMPEPKNLAERMECFRGSIRRISPKTSNVPFVSNTGPPPNGNMNQAIETSITEYTELADFAADHGVKVAIEPLNPTIINIETAVWTLEQAMNIVRAVGRPNFGVCLDFWNIWQNADIEQQIRNCGDSIFIVQASDWRNPRSFKDRLVPGQGAIPLADLLQSVRESGYDGHYVVEIFSEGVPDALWHGDLDKLIVDSRDGFNQAWQQTH